MRGGPTVAQVLIPWIKATVTTSDHAYYAAKSIIAVAGSTKVSELTSLEIIMAFALEARHTQGVRYSRTVAYRRILRYLAEECGAPNLTRAVPKVQVPAPRAVTATNREREALLNASDTSLRCWLLLCSDLAMRAQTAARISPENYNEEERTITFITKFGTAQTLPVTAEIAELFARATARMGTKAGLGGRNVAGWISEETNTPYVALLSRLGRVTYVTLQHKFTKLRKKLGITRQITAHDLRRTTAVKLYELTKDIRKVQALLGHRTLATTLYYLDHRNTPVAASSLELAKLNPITERTQ